MIGYFACIPRAWVLARERLTRTDWRDLDARYTDLRWAEDCVRFGRPFPGESRPRDTMPTLRFFARSWGVAHKTVKALRDRRHLWADPRFLAEPAPWTDCTAAELLALQAQAAAPAARSARNRSGNQQEPPRNQSRTTTEPSRNQSEAMDRGTSTRLEPPRNQPGTTPEPAGNQTGTTPVTTSPHARSQITIHKTQFTSHLQGGSGERGKLIVLEPPTRRRPPARPEPEEEDQEVLPEQPVVPALVEPAPVFPKLRVPAPDLPAPRQVPEPEPAQKPPVAASPAGGHTPSELGQMAARCWKKVFQAPIPPTRKDRSVLVELAARYGAMPLDRLERTTETYLRACQTGADWPRDPNLVNLQSRLGRYLLRTGPPAVQGEPESDGWVYDDAPAEPEAGDDSDALAGGGFSMTPPEVMAAAAALFHHDPGRRETPPTSVLLWWKEHDPQTYQAALKAVDSIEHDAGVGVLYG